MRSLIVPRTDRSNLSTFECRSEPSHVADSRSSFSQNVSQGNPEAGEIEEGAVSGEQMLMTKQQPAELTQPGISSFHDPAPLVAPQFASVFIPPFLVVLTVGCNQFDASASSGVGAAGLNRSRRRQLSVRGFVAGGLSYAARGLA